MTTYDPKCLILANSFLLDFELSSDKRLELACQLAKVIQQDIEDFCKDEGLTE